MYLNIKSQIISLNRPSLNHPYGWICDLSPNYIVSPAYFQVYDFFPKNSKTEIFIVIIKNNLKTYKPISFGRYLVPRRDILYCI